MSYTFQIMALETWGFWTGLFELLPYGDPYIATIVLFSLVAAAAKLIAGGETA